jgi:PAS domain S-box-containing protein
MKGNDKSSQKRGEGAKRKPGAARQGSDGSTRRNGTALEARFQAVFQGSQDAIGVSKAGIHVFVNPAYLELFGFPPDADLAGKPILDLIAPKSRDQIREYMLRRARHEPVSSTYETRGLRADGSVFDMAVNVSQYKENGEDITLVILRDITERKRAEETQRASEKKFSAIFGLIPDPTTITDIENGRIIDLNDAAARWFGRSREEAIGLTTADVQVWEQPSDRDRMLQAIRSNCEINDMEFRLRRRNGEIRDVLFSSRIIEINGRSFLLSRAHDITERKQMEEVLRTSEEKFRKVFLTSPDSININRLSDGMYVSINDGFTAITGYTENDVIGKTSLELNIWTDPLDRQKMVEKLRTQGEFKNLEARFRTKDGRIIDGVMSASIIEIDHQPYIVNVTRDITERKRFEFALKQSEGKYRRLYNETPILLHSIDRDARVVDVNDYWLKTMGYERDEVIGRKVLDFYTDASRKYAEEIAQPAFFRHGFAKDVSYQFVKKNGDIVDVLVSATAERDAAGNVVRSQAVIEDITERKRAEEALRESQARLDLALQSAHMGVWRLEIGENRRYFDDLACQLLGIDAEKFHGTDEEFFAAVHSEDHGKIKAVLARTIEQQLLYETTYRVVWPDRSIHDITARGRLVRDDEGQPARIIGILWDITDQRLLEDERLKTQKLESIGTLAGGIAHDFNNLLQGVFGFISMAKLTFDQREKSLAMLTQAEKALHQSVNLTSQLLTFSKGGKPVKKVFALRPLIENSVAFALSGSRITAEIAIDEDLRAVEADEGQIGQVIQNIVLNAEQAMPLGGMIRVSVRNIPAQAITPPVDLQGDLVEISIRDQGTGIPPDHLMRIFDPYFTTKEKGSGLGLATAYSIIKNHGGLLRVKSEIAKGTTFFIYLPASNAGEEVPKSPASTAAARKGRILVMDDEEIIRSVAGELLTALGHEVAFAQTGEAALEAYRAAREAGRPFDVVILDLTIRGGMGGMEALSKLIEIDPDVKAIVSSGYSDDPSLTNYIEQGFRSFLKKPYNVEDLKKTLSSLLSDTHNGGTT